MRAHARIDDNQKQIVKNLRKLGATVQSLATIGSGCPDILVGWKGNNYLFEIKDVDKAMSARKLTPDEIEWHNNWRGRVYVTHSIDEIITIINRVA